MCIRDSLKGDVQYALSGELTGNQYDIYAGYRLGENTRLYGRIEASSRMPNFNLLLYQSEYANFNWNNSSAYNKQQRRSIEFGIDAGKWGSASAQFNAIDNYTYFGLSDELDLQDVIDGNINACLLYTSPSPRDGATSRMPSSA